MTSPILIRNRYEIRDVLGRGGMGVVYKAFDALMRREVAVKTLRDAASSAFADHFYRECSVLTALVHPNIVEIFDMGEFEEDGVLRPYFVMPLLPGRTLHDLIYPTGAPLPVERCTDIVSQACRGLQAAHESGLLHRDIKPRNIFVMRDDAVKLIDFGVVRLLGNQTIGAPGTLGTLHYMAPEQIALKPLSAQADIFSLATVCYEALTGVHPFIRNSPEETAAAVAEHAPALASTLNPQVSRPLAQAVAQGMAKDPRLRFESALAFAEALQRGLRNEAPASLASGNPQNRLARAQRSFARGDLEFTREILEQLEAEGVQESEVRQLRSQLEEAIRKQQIELRLATAQRYFEGEEYALALRRVGEALAEDAGNPAALALKSRIEGKLNDRQVAEWLARATAHVESGAFGEARRLLEDALRLQPGNEGARALLREAGQRALDWPRQRQQQEELFQTAQEAYFAGHFEPALHALDQLAELTGQSKAAGARAAEYLDFRRRVRADYEALQTMLADARKMLGNGDLDGAHLLSERLREQCPRDPDVLTLSQDIAARRLEREQEYRRGIEQRIAAEPDLNARLHLLNQVARARPNDDSFTVERQKLQTLLDRVAEAVDRARGYESIGRFDYAVEEWLCVGDIHPAYPGLKDQLARVQTQWKAAREQAKEDLTAAVKEALWQGDQQGAAHLLADAQAEFQGDGDFERLKTLVERSAAAHEEAAAALRRVEEAENERRFSDLPELCQPAAELSRDVEPLRRRTFAALTALASRLTALDWRVAEQVLAEAAGLGEVPREFFDAIRHAEYEEEIGGILREEHEESADLRAYRERVVALAAQYPAEERLADRIRLIDSRLEARREQDEKRACAAALSQLRRELGETDNHHWLWEAYIRAKNLSAPFADDHEISQLFHSIGEQGTLFEEAAEALARDRVRDCLSICAAMLERYPGHRLFQKLKDQGDARDRELGEEYLARVERWLASEPDLNERERIVRKAQEEYPHEARFAEELETLEREKAIVDSMAQKAHDLEKKGQMPEALAQWRQVRNIHAAYPGLEAQIAHCESFLDRQHRKIRAQRLLPQGQAQLAEGHFEEGYQAIREAWELSQEIPDLLRAAAPDLVAAARAVLPTSPKLAESMVNLAQTLDDVLRIPKDMRARITEACKAEDLTECLHAIKSYNEAENLTGALSAADVFLARYPGVKQVEALRSRILIEVERERKQRARARALDELHEMESRAVNLSAPELLELKASVEEVARRQAGDEEVTQRASTLEALFSSLAEVRGYLAAGDVLEVQAACAHALERFPGHPLFKAAQVEAAQLKSEKAAEYAARVRQRALAEGDFSKRAAILRAGLAQYPGEPSLAEEFEATRSAQTEMNARIARIRGLEEKQQLLDAIREWEALRKTYPWYSGADAEIERLSAVRRKEKQEGIDRWLRQVEGAIENGDYESASAMLRQAAQQQPDRTLQSLEEKLNEGIRKKQESDAHLAEGKRLLAHRDLARGGNALYRAYELQPKDKDKADVIVATLLTQIRASITQDFAACEGLLSHLNRIRPDQILPPDLREAMAQRRLASRASGKGLRKLEEKLARLTSRFDAASSKRALSSVRKNLQSSGLLDSTDFEIRRQANELLWKLDLAIGGAGEPRRDTPHRQAPDGRGFSIASVVAVALLLLAIAGMVLLLAPPYELGALVEFNVTPDHSVVEINGQTCTEPDCKFRLKAGEYLAKIRKEGYKPRNVVVTVKPGDLIPLNFTAALEPLAVPLANVSNLNASSSVRTPVEIDDGVSLAKIRVRGALPRTRFKLDGADLGAADEKGVFLVDVPPGPHTLELSLDGFSNRTIKREFARGETVLLADTVVRLERNIE